MPTSRSTSAWTQTASAVAALATASRPAVTYDEHYITGVSASYSAAQIGLLQIKDGATVVWEGYVHNQKDVSFPKPLQLTNGNAVSAELTAGAAGVTGKVTLIGYTG